MRHDRLSRRDLLKAAAAIGISASVMPLSRATAALMDVPVTAPADWTDGKGVRFRQDGIPKVIGEKVFATDIRARDMPGWPSDQSYALLLRVTRADRIYQGIDLAILCDDLQPDRLVREADLTADGVAMPNEPFYGPLLLGEGETPVFLGQPVAMLIYRDYPRFRAARQLLKFRDDVIRYGAETGVIRREPYGATRFVRVGGATPYDADRFSPLKDGTVTPPMKDGEPAWPKAEAGGDIDARAMYEADRIGEQLSSPPDGWTVFRRKYSSQSIEQAPLETDNGNAWYDAGSRRLHVVLATQSPYTNAAETLDMVKASQFALDDLRLHPGYTVGYGQKDHSSFPYYVVMAGLYGGGKAVRLSLDRFEHFQSAMKRHAFDIDNTIAVDKQTGEFRALRSLLSSNGGGRQNLSASVARVAAAAAQSVYYFPDNDIAATAYASRAVTAGSMRGYGTLQSMSAMEIMVDEMAEELGLDAIDLRLRNVLKSGMKTTQGAIPAGAIRVEDMLQRARKHPIWTEREARKTTYEADNPGFYYGSGFACVQKDYGGGAEAAIAQVEVDTEGKIHLRHVCLEIGAGSTTSQMVIVKEWLGRPAHTADFAVIDWPQMPVVSNGEPFTNTQEFEDRSKQDPRWVPIVTTSRASSNSAYFYSHSTREAARILFEKGLWPAAMAIWSEGISGGQAGPLPVRPDEAHWEDDTLRASALEPLSLARLARKADEMGLITGVTVHSFNRWAWAEAEFDVAGETLKAPIDALSVRWGSGASDVLKASMTDEGYAFLPRTSVTFPPVQLRNAAVVYYAPHAALVEVSVNSGSGEVQVLNHHSILECGSMIVPQLVSGQLEGGVAMGTGHALFEDLPLYEDGPGNGTWNFNRYRLPRAKDVAVWSQTSEILDPLSPTDPAKGIGEVAMIPIVPAIANAIAHATGHRFRDLPVSADKIREALQ